MELDLDAIEENAHKLIDARNATRQQPGGGFDPLYDVALDPATVLALVARARKAEEMETKLRERKLVEIREFDEPSSPDPEPLF